MLKINIVCVGNLKESYLREAAREYIKRLSGFCRLNITEISESSPEKEKKDIIKNLNGYTVALCIEGDEISSVELADKIEKICNISSAITFIIGGSEGLSGEVKDIVDYKLSFSKMTFPHQLMRVILLEQIYRAFTINKNIKYHK